MNICSTCGAELKPDCLDESSSMLRCMNPMCPGKGPVEGLESFTTANLIDELRSRSVVFFCCMVPKVRRGFDWLRCFGGRVERVFYLIELTKSDLIRTEFERNRGDNFKNPQMNEDLDDEPS